MKKKDDEPLTYRSAADEIEEILTRLDDDKEVDIDGLADQVERATELISFCSARLRNAQLRVRKVTEELARATATVADEPEDEE